MSFTKHIKSRPVVFDDDVYKLYRDKFNDCGKSFRELAASVASNSPYLSSLLEMEEDWLRANLDREPKEALAECISTIRADGFTTLSSDLRQAKRRVALLTALADLGGVWDLREITAQLTRFADAAVQTSIDYLIDTERARGKLPDVPAKNAGLTVIAMGKMGAFELNYSSDIDLIVLFDEALYPPQDYMEIRKILVRVTQRMVKLLSENTAEGYVFRTDLRLRPNPSSTPVCIGVEAAERYYESEGRTWERAAFIKARACAGDIETGERFLLDLQPFIWRKHLDFAAIQDAHDMRLRIREHKGFGGDIELAGHDVKLGAGGIREIEFFTQTRQLICGGRDSELRHSGTLEGLNTLAQKEWIAPEIQTFFEEAYTAHRTLEHRLQMVNDQQTQTMPAAEDAMKRIAAFSGFASVDRFVSEQTERFTRVHALTETFFSPNNSPAESDTSIWDGFEDPHAVKERVAGWSNFASMRSTRAQEIFDRLLPALIEQLKGALSPIESLTQFERFLKGLPAGVQVFSMFEANEKLLELFVDIITSAPRLAEYLGTNPGVLDAVLGSEFFLALPTLEALTKELSDALVQIEDYELKLDTARRWAKEYHFRIGVQLLRGTQDTRSTASAYTDLAEASLKALLPVVTAEFAKRYGFPPGQGAAVIGMGKLGSGEMTATSDLDLIIVYDAEGIQQSDGKRPLATSAYYARLTQALVAALTAPTSEGAVYEVDMRLRPSGRQGPVAVSLSAFAHYQLEEAWTWEHLALTRARVVSGPSKLQAGVEAATAAALTKQRDVKKVISDAGQMRARILAAHPATSAFEVKSGPGRMQDIELVLQTGMLTGCLNDEQSPRRAIPALIKTGWLNEEEAETFEACLELCTILQQVGRIADSEGYLPTRAGKSLNGLILKTTGQDTILELEKRCEQLFEQSFDIANRLIPLVDEAISTPSKA